MAPDDVKAIAVQDGASRGPVWRAEKWGDRYLFIGPAPGRFLFTSVGAGSWDDAIRQARAKWAAYDKIQRHSWYGPSGRFTHPRAE